MEVNALDKSLSGGWRYSFQYEIEFELYPTASFNDGRTVSGMFSSGGLSQVQQICDRNANCVTRNNVKHGSGRGASPDLRRLARWDDYVEGDERGGEANRAFEGTT